MASTIYEYSGRRYIRGEYKGIPIIRIEGTSLFNATQFVVENSYSRLRSITRNKYWKDFEKELASRDPRLVETLFINAFTTKENSWIRGTYYDEIYLDFLISHISLNKSIDPSKLGRANVEEAHIVKEKVDNVEDEIISNGETFYRTKYMDISVIVDSNGYYFATGMCKSNGKKFKRLTETNGWKEIIDYGTKVISSNYNLNKEEIRLIVSRKDQINELQGKYIHPILINYVAMWISKEYIIKFNEIMNLVNREINERGISLDEKLTKYKTKVEELERRLKNCNYGFNNDFQGSVRITHISNSNNFKLRFSPTKQHLLKNSENIVIPIFNPYEIERLFNYYTSKGKFDNLTFISKNLVISESFEDIQARINEIINFQVPITTSREEMTKKAQELVKRYNGSFGQLRGKLFEFFCSFKYGIPLFSDSPVESIGFKKSDCGVDLISFDEHVLAQCKYYTSTLEIHRLITFEEMIDSIDFDAYLLVNENIKLAPEVENSDKWAIVRVPVKEFEEWVTVEITPFYNKPTSRNIEITDDFSEDIKRVCSIGQWTGDQLVEELSKIGITLTPHELRYGYSSLFKPKNYIERTALGLRMNFVFELKDNEDTVLSTIEEFILNWLEDKPRVRRDFVDASNLTSLINERFHRFDINKYYYNLDFKSLEFKPIIYNKNVRIHAVRLKRDLEPIIKNLLGMRIVERNKFINELNSKTNSNFSIADFDEDFGHLFHRNLNSYGQYDYRHSIDANGKNIFNYMIANHNELLADFVKNRISSSQILKDDLVKLLNDELRMEITSSKLSNVLGDLLISRTFMINRVSYNVLELNYNLFPEVGKSILKYLSERNPSLEDFNSSLHRYDTKSSFNNLIATLQNLP